MTKLPREEIEKIIRKDLPGYRLTEQSVSSEDDYESMGDSDSTFEERSAEAVTPDIDKLRMKYLYNKYLGQDSASSDDSVEADDSYESLAEDGHETDEEDEDEIVAVSPESSSHPWDRSARPKAAVISGKEKKVIGQQG